MKTWQNFNANAGAAVTTWNYDIARGWLTNKTYDGGAPGPRYTYTAAGRLATRLWARGTNTTYGYDNLGNLSPVSYNDGVTAGSSYAYDRRGRQALVTVGTTSTSSQYDDLGNLLSESYSGGPLSGLSITNGYDQFLRRTNLVLLSGSSVLSSTAYKYDTASRLSTVSDGTNTAGYSYLANSPLLSQIGFTNAGIQRMVTTKQYDLLNRLTNLTSVSSVQSIANFAYVYNSANQRTKRTDLDGSYWIYTYDALGQVTSGKRYWSDGTPVAGQQFTYGFDDIGNRPTTASGGDQFGLNLRSATYSANLLNQYTNRTVPGYLDIQGEARTNATVTIWNSDGTYTQTYRKGEFYRGELPVTNSLQPLWFTVTNLAVLNNGTNADIVTNAVENDFFAKDPESFAYDPDGNLTNDGRFAYLWDGENRIVAIKANTSMGPQISLRFDYDWQGRRMQKRVYSDTTWTTLTNTVQFLYGGWNVEAEVDVSHAPLRTYMWGLDLTGSVQDGGGVGGLIGLGDGVGGNGFHFVAFDGSGNVSSLADSLSGSCLATYLYNTFGELLRLTGPKATSNPFRFSTKYMDTETGLINYSYRTYSPSIGRWLSKDRLDEHGSVNLYVFVENAPVSRFDALGLYSLVFDEGMGSRSRQDTVNALQTAIGNKIPSIITRINKELKDNKFAPGCCAHDKYEKVLKDLLNIVTKIQQGVNSSDTLHLKSNSSLDNGPAAYAETKGPSGFTFGKITTTFQDKPGPTRFWDLNSTEQAKTWFHEMSHYVGTQDGSDYVPNEAETYAILYSDDEAELKGKFKAIQNKAYFDCVDLEKKAKNKAK